MNSGPRRVLLLLIIVLGLFFRLTRADELFHFEMDEEVIAWKTQKFWRDGQPFLIGGGTPFGFHLGSAFYYLSALPLIFTKGDPNGWIVLISLLSISNLYLIWLVGKTLYSETVGLVAVALWSFSFTTVMFDRHWWPLVLDPLFSLLTILSLFHILKGRSRWWIVLGLTLSFAWQADLTNLVLFVATGIVAMFTFVIPRVLVLSKDEGTRNLTKSFRIRSGIYIDPSSSAGMTKYFFIGLGILILSFIPLVFFELRHPGANLGRLSITRSDPARAGSDLVNSILDLARFIPSTFASLLIPSWRSNNLADWYTWCKDVAASRISTSPIQMIIAAGFFFYPLVRWVRKRQPADFVMTIILVSGIGGISLFRLFGGDLFDFYLAPLYPIFFIAAAMVVISLIKHTKRKYLILSVVAMLSVLNVSSMVSVQHRLGLLTKREAVSWVKEQVGDRPFALESISGCHRYNGTRYLFMLADNEPVMSFMDPTLSWLYDEPPATTYPDLFVAFVTPRDLTVTDQSRYNELKRHAISAKQFGDFDVVIAENNDRRFQIYPESRGIDFSPREGTSD